MINSIGVTSYNNYQTTGSVKPAAEKEVEFSYNSQDQVVMQPGTTSLQGISVSKNGPESDRVQLQGTKIKPNKNGNFVFSQNDKRFVGAQTFATVNKTISTFESSFGHPIAWAFNDRQIGLLPDAGSDFNAYYSRDDASLNFFHGQDPVTDRQVLSGASGEIVSHEVGHAMLDGIRPGYFDTWKADTNGFHEAFADCTAMLMSTQDDNLCNLVAEQTGGDLTKQNSLAANGEELGKAINNVSGKNVTGGDFIRNAINDFKWQAPNTVPKNPSGTDPLTTEMHSWSRIWTGAQYDMLGDMVTRNMGEGMTAAEALKSAGSEVMSLYGGMMKHAPKVDASYRDMALCLLKADDEAGGKNHDLILKSFQNRNILFEGDDTPAMTMSALGNEPRTVTVTLDGDFGIFSGAEVSTKTNGGEMSAFDADAQELKGDMKRLIDQGKILYTEPNQVVEHKDLFDKNGQPYMGVVRWTDGKMVIERNHMIS